MQQKHFLRLFVLCAVVCIGHELRLSAQNCVDMTALGQKNAIVCYDEQLQLHLQATNDTLLSWDIVKPSEQHPHQQLVTTAGTDALCPQLRTLPPSGEPSICLSTDDEDNTDPTGAGVVFRITVDKEHTTIILNFAGMMEKTTGIHTDYSQYAKNYGDYIQPSMFFKLTVGDQDSLIKETPMTFTPNASNTWIPFVTTNGRAAVWRDWTPVAYDLSKFIGRQVNVYANVRDCALKGMNIDSQTGKVISFITCDAHHTARAYVNVTCAPAISIESQDCGKGENRLSMPEGFLSYKWYYQSDPTTVLGTERNVVLPAGHPSDTICCEVVHYVVETPVVKKFYLPNNCSFCADQANITYQLPEGLGEIATYDILFDKAATAQGFADITNATLSTPNMLAVAMPKYDNSYVRPDNYSAQIVLHMADKTTTTIDWDFSILYPSSIIGQDWNDVLYIKNKDYNGGYNITHIKWLKNGNEVSGRGEHNGYFVNDASFTGQDLYSALLTRSDDGKTIGTCPCQPAAGNPDEIDFGGVQVTYTAPGRLHISSMNISGEFRVYDLCGNLFANGQFGPKTHATELDIQVTWPMGVYVLQLHHEDGKTENKKMLIF